MLEMDGSLSPSVIDSILKGFGSGLGDFDNSAGDSETEDVPDGSGPLGVGSLDNGPGGFTENVFHAFLCYWEEVYALPSNPSFLSPVENEDCWSCNSPGLLPVLYRPCKPPQLSLQVARQPEMFKSIEVGFHIVYSFWFL